MKSVLISLLTLSLSCVVHAERVSGPAGKVHTYKEVDGVKRDMEVYFPEGHDSAKKPVPGIIFFHGGGWGGGSRDAAPSPIPAPARNQTSGLKKQIPSSWRQS